MRRRTPLRVHGVRTSNPFDNLSLDQLSYIGAVVMKYNDVEALVGDICAAGLRIPIRNEEVLTRINGVEGRAALVKLTARHWGFTDDEMALLCDALGEGGFSGLKKWRDGVVHARMLDINSSVGRLTQKQGVTEDVLLSLDALKGLFRRLELMRAELWRFMLIVQRKARIGATEISDQHRERLEQEIQAEWVQVREFRNQRRLLPPMPEWPEDTPDFGLIQSALAKAADKL
jgi:hypothetical protein